MGDLENDLVRIGDLELRFRVTDPGATVFEFIVPSNARVPAPHYHEQADELIYGLEGILDVTVEGKTTAIGPGQAIFIPRGAVHHHANPYGQVARVLAVITPGTIGKAYFEELAEIVKGPGKPDPARVKDVMDRHGLAVA